MIEEPELYYNGHVGCCTYLLYKGNKLLGVSLDHQGRYMYSFDDKDKCKADGNDYFSQEGVQVDARIFHGHGRELYLAAKEYRKQVEGNSRRITR